MNIYDQHAAAFKQVSAFVLVKDGKQVGTVAFKYPKDGAGRLYCYLKVHGVQMVRGMASGYGYDKAGAAFERACDKLGGIPRSEHTSQADLFFTALAGLNIGGQDWASAVKGIGFNVFRAV